MNFRFRLMLAGALAFAAAGCAASAGGTGGGGTPTAQGMRPVNNNQTREAEKSLNLAIASKSPTFFQAALDSANSAITLNPDNPLGHLIAGQALLGLNRPREAAAALAKAEELRPAYVPELEPIREEAWINQYTLAQPLLDSGDYLEAAEVLEAGNLLYRKRPEIMIVLGQIYAQDNQAEKAVEHLRRADSLITARLPELDSTMAASWTDQRADIPVAIAQAYISAGRFDEAAGSLRDLLATDPDNVMYARNLASIYAQGEQPDSAAVVYDRLFRRTDLSPADLYDIGIGYYSMDMYPKAVDAFKRVVDIAPKDHDAIEMWARTIQLGQIEARADGTEPTPAELAELARVAEQWVALEPNSQIGMLILAQTFNNANNEARTVEIIEKMDVMSVSTSDLQLRRNPAGGATVNGVLENLKADPGTAVTLTFTFYDAAGNAIGTQSTRVNTADAQAKTPFSVQFGSDRQVDGYGYTLGM